MPASPQLLLLGTGQTGLSIIRRCGARIKITASTRNPNRIFELVEAGATPLIMPIPTGELVEPLAAEADVVVTFPPDGTTDSILAPACSRARRLIYISSTGVYGKEARTVDDTSPVDENDERMHSRLDAEKCWREQGAIVLRPPGIYGPESGLHIRLANGSYKLPGDGLNYTSRIHVDDLARIILAVLEQDKLSRQTYVLGDTKPCTQLEIITWLCNKMKLSVPQSVEIDQAPPSLRGNRSVDPSGLLKELDFKLLYPSYKEGYEQCLQTAGSA